MKRSALYALLLGGGALAIATPFYVSSNRKPGWDVSRRQYTLPNGWGISPVGRSVTLPGDMPGNILVIDGGRRALVNTCGFHDHSLSLVDLQDGHVVASVPFQKSWIGLARLGDDVLLSAGQGGGMHRFSVDELKPREQVVVPGPTGNDRFVSSIVVGAEGTYALNIQTDEVFLLDGSDVKAKAKVSYRPYGAVLSPDGTTLAVSEWGNRSVVLLDAKSLDVQSRVTVGSHPTAVAYAADGRLFVSNAGSTSVSVIKGGKVVETIEVGVDAARRIGPTPVALALDAGGKRLFVANAGENCVALVDVSKPGRAR
ncbi:hypothetical protein EON82_16900, partial [bacterium]